MQQGGNIPDRNVAMSRMADMLGMKGLIAKSRKVRIKHKDGTVRSGVFQEAEEFSDADIPLQQEDAAKIEVLYRQMRLAAKEPAKPVPKKPGLAQTIRNAKRKASEAQEMRVGKLE